MADFNWDNYQQVKPQQGDNGQFNWNEHPIAPGYDDPNAPGKLEALLRGGAQGATFGFADELAGAGSSALDTLLGKNGSMDDVIKDYQKNRDDSRAAFDAAQKAHPYLYMGGQLAGGLVPGVLTGGAGEVAEGANVANQLGRAMRTGTIAGAAMGLGNSTADLTKGNAGQAVKDTIEGAGGGMAGGLLGGIVGTGISGLANSKTGKVLKTAYQMGSQNENFLNPETRKSIGQEAFQAIDSYLDRILGENPNSAISKAKAQFQVLKQQFANKKIDLTQATQQVEQIFNDLGDEGAFGGDKQKLLADLHDFTRGVEKQVPVQATPYNPQSVENIPAKKSGLAQMQEKLAQLQDDLRDQGIDAKTKLEHVVLADGTPKIKGTIWHDEPALANERAVVSPQGDVEGLAGGPNDPSHTAGAFNGLDNADNYNTKLKNYYMDPTPGQEAGQVITPGGAAGPAQTIGTATVREGGSPIMDYDEARRLKALMQNRTRFESGMATKEAQNAAEQATKIVNDATEAQVPGLQKANDDFHTLDQLRQELSLGNKDTSNAQRLSTLLTRNDNDTITGDKSRYALDQLIGKVQPVDPELATQMQSDAQRIGARNEAIRAYTGEAHNKGNTLATQAYGGLVGAANIAGQVGEETGLNTLAKGIHKGLFSMPKEGLASIGNQFMSSSNPVAKSFGQVLVNASERDEIGRNALLFTLMQQPVYRDMVHNNFLK